MELENVYNDAEISRRIKKLREEYLGLSQEQFSHETGIGQSTISMFETGRRRPRQIHLSHICATYGISEDWLTHGIGEIRYAKTFSLDDYAEKKHLNRQELNLIRAYMELDANVRIAILGIFKKAFETDDANSWCPPTEEELEQQYVIGSEKA